jgi:5-carboxymethyl-2-hydroxymuconate isomerase
MRLASFLADGTACWGEVHGDRIVQAEGGDATLLGFVRSGAATPPPGREWAASDVRLLPPLDAPEKIICVGVNYHDRNAEYRDGSAAPAHPSLFFRTPGSLVGHGAPIEWPRVSAQLDYEGEIALVVGRGGRHIAEDAALDHIFGATLCNEGSVRDWMRHGKFNVTQGKNFERSGSIGPWITTSDAVDLARPLHLTTRVNGELRQDETTARMIFSFAALVAYISIFTALRPGDVIVTGTPTGAGARSDPPRWLVPGDVVEIAVPELGVLCNTVREETS